MLEKIKVSKTLVDFYEKFGKGYYMSKLISKLETDYNWSRRFSVRNTLIPNEIFEYIEENGLENTVETLWEMHLNGYEVEGEVQKYKIVFGTLPFYQGEKVERVLWDAEGEWVFRPDDYFFEDEFYRKSFTMEEILKNFPALAGNAVKVN
ncbi:hypothetical protein Si034_01291 [Streptococcus infantarius subsp. infantarius]|nr:hypothetical protein [Streptococcus infantarius subsp. infantarius]MCO4641668.1 hypothetical protein [Streptococcus infantarius subsp. infantarius]MCO4643441.1 hypothetical protein [Streptococcus infantarius subsp. infantarius]